MIEITESSSVESVAELEYAFGPSPFGEVLTAVDDCGLCFAGFVTADRRSALDDLHRRFPRAALKEVPSAFVDIFGEVEAVHIVGSEFRRKVWKTLLGVGRGCRISYSQLADMAGMPRSVRAVASAVADNPLSIVVPCHRVVRSDGATGEYYWGAELKRRLLEAEKC